jgi:hypothetical protein
MYYLKNYEGFDARLSDISLESCGSLCTETYGCKGFAFDDKTKKCYLSKYVIIQKPQLGIYTDEYNTEYQRCNKIFPIEENTNEIKQEDKRQNMFYSCSKKEDDKFELKKIVNEKIISIDKKTIDDIPYEEYNMEDIIWPINKKDFLQKDILLKKEEMAKKVYVFEKDKDEHLGQYLFPYKCVSNIPEKECIDTCIKDNDCVGVEINPVLLKDTGKGQDMYTNVCCPKRQITEIINRRDDYKNGSFYVKRLENNLNKDDGYYIRLKK